MRPTPWLLVVMLAASACGSAIAPHQADGADCNYAEAPTACGAASFCDPGEPAGDQGYARRHTWGLFGDKTHVVGTCRAKGAAGAPCSRAEGCASGRCARPNPAAPGACD
jgi:hypothetical protein